MLTQPIFDAGRTQANLDLALVRKNIAVAQYESTIQQAFREVADLLSARERIARQLDAQMTLERTQQQRLALTEARYREGITSFLRSARCPARRLPGLASGDYPPGSCSRPRPSSTRRSAAAAT